MDTETARVVGMICAAVAVVATPFYYVYKAREVRALEAIRDSLKRNEK